jgi:magnesium chelatase accessory protein
MVGVSGLDWTRESATWPNAASSRFVDAGGLRWHVQMLGAGPTCLMLHGTGASTHSWRGLVPRLSPHMTLVMPDLPGHGFTARPERAAALTLPGMAASLADLLRTLDVAPGIAIGHSAGAAIALRMQLDRSIRCRMIIGLNAALLPFGGAGSALFAPLARLLAGSALTARLLARRAADRQAVADTLAGTGSTLTPEDVDLYHRLFASKDHVRSALQMMAGWDLETLGADLTRLDAPLRLIAAGEDLSVPATQAFTIRDRVPGVEVTYLRGLGHLAHEENPDLVAATLLDLLGLPRPSPGTTAP